jgi:hypothetical protein
LLGVVLLCLEAKELKASELEILHWLSKVVDKIKISNRCNRFIDNYTGKTPLFNQGVFRPFECRKTLKLVPIASFCSLITLFDIFYVNLRLSGKFRE